MKAENLQSQLGKTAMKISFITGLLAVIATTAAQAFWMPIAFDTRGNNWAMDYSTIKKTDKVYRVWQKVIYSKEFKGKSKKAPDYKIELMEYDCEEERSRSLSSTEYSGYQEDQSIFSMRTTPLEWTYVTPDTIGGGMLNAACSQAK